MEPLLTIKQFADLAQLHPNTVRKMILDGKIHAVNMGSGKKNYYRISASEITRLSFMQKNDRK